MVLESAGDRGSGPQWNERTSSNPASGGNDLARDDESLAKGRHVVLLAVGWYDGEPSGVGAGRCRRDDAAHVGALLGAAIPIAVLALALVLQSLLAGPEQPPFVPFS